MQGHSGEHKGMQGIQGNTGNTGEYIVIQGNIGHYRIIQYCKQSTLYLYGKGKFGNCRAIQGNIGEFWAIRGIQGNRGKYMEIYLNKGYQSRVKR